jgi:hypothetical protein
VKSETTTKFFASISRRLGFMVAAAGGTTVVSYVTSMTYGRDRPAVDGRGVLPDQRGGRDVLGEPGIAGERMRRVRIDRRQAVRRRRQNAARLHRVLGRTCSSR